MKSIVTLIKVSKKELDEKRLELTKLEGQRAQLIEWREKMYNELAREADFASKNPEMSITFDFYRNLINKRQLNLNIALDDVELQIERLTAQVAAMFAEIKKYEIIEQQKVTTILKEQKRRETKALDEIALNNYLKNNNN